MAMKTRTVLVVGLILLLLPGVVAAEEERMDGGYFTLVDEGGQVLTKTARYLDIGDTYIGADNREYQVVAIDGDTVKMDFVGEVEMPPLTVASSPSLMARLLAQDKKDAGTVGVYCTHSAESYVPDSGIESKDTGDIFKVAGHFSQALENQGLDVIFSDNNHNPHDGGAYNRSRRTVRELLEAGAVAMFDVHRDATPPEVYQTEVNGEPMTKIRLVVGRQNANREANLEYAKRLKAKADEEFPGLIEGIFNARGSYNQDVGPRMMLLEFGTHLTSVEEAQKSADLFARIVPAAAGLTTASRGGAAKQIGGAAWRSLLWVIGIVFLGVIAFLALNAGSWEEVGGRLRSFFSKEMANTMGPVEGEDDEGED
ncbi:MAG: stage II sporulation protein P [Limnochordia bacterium]|jgi:stage II sporulation protein P